MPVTVSEGALLAAWEAGVGRRAPQQALILLASAADPARRSEVGLLPVGIRNILLLALHRECFGTRLDCIADCPNCGEELEFGLDVDEIMGGPDMSDVDSWLTEFAEQESRPLVLRAGEFEVAVLPPTGADLVAVSSAPKSEARQELLARCLVDASVDVFELPEPRLAELIESIGDGLAEADPHSVIGFEPSCEECGHRWSAELDVVGFVWTEVDAWARRLLTEVHLLASAYGWTEFDVLSVGSARRQFYLRAVAG
ncbi:MAG TPA: hypothetical protein VGM75_09905 [Pseudonocardiaceae bacterium]|jgi:hypothetical protein